MPVSVYILLFSLIAASNGAKILALLPANITSHYIIFDSIMTELASRGHDVTVVNTFPKTAKLQNFTDVDVRDCAIVPPDLFILHHAHRRQNPWRQLSVTISMNDRLKPVLTCPPVQDLLLSNTKFNLVITEIFGGDLMLGIAKRFEAPIISFCAASQIYQWGLNRMGSPFNPSYMSYSHTDLPLISTDSTFYNRLYNTVLGLYCNMWYHYANRLGDAAIRKYIDPQSPPLFDIAKNTSLVLTFSHFSVSQPIPLVPNVIEIAGVHIKDAKRLPQVCAPYDMILLSFTDNFWVKDTGKLTDGYSAKTV